MKTHALFVSALVAAALPATGAAAVSAPSSGPAPLRVLLVAGGCCHDYARQTEILKRGLEARAHVKVDVLFNSEGKSETVFGAYFTPEWSTGYDLVIHDECTTMYPSMEYVQNAIAPHAAGKPAVFLHCAMHTFRTEGWNASPAPAVTPWFELTGLQTTGHGRRLPIELSVVDPESPITRGLGNWTTGDEELYNNPGGGVLPTAHALMRGKQGAADTVVTWTNLYRGRTRIFGTTLGHTNETVSDPRYLDLVARGLLWAADKLNAEYLKPAPMASAPIAAPATSGLATADCGCDEPPTEGN